MIPTISLPAISSYCFRPAELNWPQESFLPTSPWGRANRVRKNLLPPLQLVENLILFKSYCCHKQYDKQHAFQGQQCAWVFLSLCALFIVIFAHFWHVPVTSSTTSPCRQECFSPPKAAKGAGSLSMLQPHVCYGQDAFPYTWKHPGALSPCVCEAPGGVEAHQTKLGHGHSLTTLKPGKLHMGIDADQLLLHRTGSQQGF